MSRRRFMGERNFKMEGLICYLKFNGSPFDEVSKSVFEIQGSNVNFNQDGKIGKCAYIGANSSIKLVFPKAYYAELTMSLWVNKNSWPRNGYNTIYSSRSSYATLFGGNNDNNLFYIIPGGQNESFITSPATGSWQHIVIRLKNSSYEWFINGVKRNTVSGSYFYTTNAYLGRDYINSSYDRSLYGSIDEFAVFDRALSDAEITQLYNGGNALEL